MMYWFSDNGETTADQNSWNISDEHGSGGGTFHFNEPLTYLNPPWTGGVSFSRTASGSGADRASYSYTVTQSLSGGAWSSASGTGWASGGASTNWGYSGSGGRTAIRSLTIR